MGASLLPVTIQFLIAMVAYANNERMARRGIRCTEHALRS